MNTPSLARVIPALSWLRAYDRSWLRSDVFAGITLAAPMADALAATSRRERRAQRRHQSLHGARVVVVGAGLAGLTCAYRLRQNGISADVFEARDSRLGGRCWTVRGFRHEQVAGSVATPVQPIPRSPRAVKVLPSSSLRANSAITGGMILRSSY